MTTPISTKVIYLWTTIASLISRSNCRTRSDSLPLEKFGPSGSRKLNTHDIQYATTNELPCGCSRVSRSKSCLQALILTTSIPSPIEQDVLSRPVARNNNGEDTQLPRKRRCLVENLLKRFLSAYGYSNASCGSHRPSAINIIATGGHCVVAGGLAIVLRPIPPQTCSCLGFFSEHWYSPSNWTRRERRYKIVLARFLASDLASLR